MFFHFLENSKCEGFKWTATISLKFCYKLMMQFVYFAIVNNHDIKNHYYRYHVNTAHMIILLFSSCLKFYFKCHSLCFTTLKC